jgi:hypothetical protein
MLNRFLKESDFLSRRRCEMKIDAEGLWLILGGRGEFVLNRDSWGLLTRPFEEIEYGEIVDAAAKSSLIFDVGANFGFHSRYQHSP